MPARKPIARGKKTQELSPGDVKKGVIKGAKYVGRKAAELLSRAPKYEFPESNPISRFGERVLKSSTVQKAVQPRKKK